MSAISTSPVANGNWVHLAVLIDRINAKLYLLVNNISGIVQQLTLASINLDKKFAIGSIPAIGTSATMHIRSLRLYEFTDNEIYGTAAEVLNRIQSLIQQHMNFESLLYS